jgi:hypothetical protein
MDLLYYIVKSMGTAFRSRTLVLFVGDVFFFTFALWLSLYLRVFGAPSQALFLAHLEPFSLLFVGVLYRRALRESVYHFGTPRYLSGAPCRTGHKYCYRRALFLFHTDLWNCAENAPLYLSHRLVPSRTDMAGGVVPVLWFAEDRECDSGGEES